MHNCYNYSSVGIKTMLVEAGGFWFYKEFQLTLNKFERFQDSKKVILSNLYPDIFQKLDLDECIIIQYVPNGYKIIITFVLQILGLGANFHTCVT